MGNCCGSPAKCAHASSTTLSGAGNVQSDTKKDLIVSGQKLPLESLEKSLKQSKADTFFVFPKKTDAILCSNLKSFPYDDLKNATENFRSDCLLGEGGFGCVFKGWIDEKTSAPTRPGTGIAVAVKKLRAGSFQGHKEWLTEVNYLGQLRHENLVKLIGYCAESENRLLVYEYMPEGCLENHLFGKGAQPLPWNTRMNIAIGIARGLSFLHSLDANVIFRDLKASNILLDSDFNVRLSDFGLARDGPTGDKTHVSTRVVGTQGYAAPEYIVRGHLTPKSDVYSFGVVLLELLSGRRALSDSKLGYLRGSLVDWAKPFLSESRKVSRIMDTRLGGQYSKKGAQAAAALVLQCVDYDPKNRPSMADVLTALEQLPTSKDMTRIPPVVKLDHHVSKDTGNVRDQGAVV